MQAAASHPATTIKKDLDVLENKKIALATEGFTPDMRRYGRVLLKNRSALSSENALTICDYIIAMKREFKLYTQVKLYKIQYSIPV
jgi:hypothetical protein